MSVFYNRKIDQLAMGCPICDSVQRRLEGTSDADLDWFEIHLKAQHGMHR